MMSAHSSTNYTFEYKIVVYSIILKVHFVRKLNIESHSQLLKYWSFGLVAYQPKVSDFDELGVRLKNQPSNCGPWKAY